MGKKNSDSGSEHEEKKSKGKARAKKDPNAPKRAMSGYMAYGAKRRPELKVSDPKLAFGDITKKIAEEWNGLSDAQKKPFNDIADADKVRYAKEKAAYEASGGAPAKKAAPKKKATKKKKESEEEDGGDEGGSDE